MAAHPYAEAGYHERYSEDEEMDEKPSAATTMTTTSSLDGDTPTSTRNPKSSFLRHNSSTNMGAEGG